MKKLNPETCKSMREKSEMTWLKKYGVTNPFAEPEIIKKIRMTKFKKYGDEHYNNHQQTTETLKLKYGVTHQCKIPEVILKRTKTRTDKFLNTVFSGNRLGNLVTPLWTKEQFVTAQEEYPFQCNTCKTIFDDNLEDGKIPKCPKCFKNNNISIMEVEFLNKLKINTRQKYIAPFKVDGSNNNKIFEFLGDYWHGNPHRFNHNDINKKNKKSYGELYNNTIKKFKSLFDRDYTIYYVWEHDYNIWKKNPELTFPIRLYNPNKLI